MFFQERRSRSIDFCLQKRLDTKNEERTSVKSKLFLLSSKDKDIATSLEGLKETYKHRVFLHQGSRMGSNTPTVAYENHCTSTSNNDHTRTSPRFTYRLISQWKKPKEQDILYAPTHHTKWQQYFQWKWPIQWGSMIILYMQCVLSHGKWKR